MVLADPFIIKPAYDGKFVPQGDVPLRLRKSAVERLRSAHDLLPEGLDLVILDGWRSRAFQARLVAFYGDDAATSGYVSSATDKSLIPPHCTGGAIDLTLAVDGVALALGSDFDDFSPRAHLTALEREPMHGSLECLLRRLLYGVLVQVGFAPYQLEWWHFSFGDQHWAAYYGLDASIYGEVRNLD
jgi:D-alanyl-D-alanine dipeptidase